MTTLRSSYLSARQIADQVGGEVEERAANDVSLQLRRFVAVNETPPGAPAGQGEAVLGQALADTGFTLLKLKEQLLYENR